MMDVDDRVRYARLLGRIFPLGSNKKPLRGSHPKDDAVEPTASVIADLLEQHPAYGIHLNPGVVVLDADSAAGVASLRARGLPRTVVVKTKRGFHFAFADPTGRLCGRRQFLPGVDLAAHAGAPWYVVGPGSRHPDGPIYEIVEGADILTAGTLPTVPDWIYEEAARAKRPPSTVSINFTSNHSVVPPARLAQIAAAFPTTRKGARHARLLDLAVCLRAAGADRDSLALLCADAAAVRCDPPFTSHADHQDLAGIIGWAMTHAGMTGRAKGDLLDAAIWYGTQWPAPVAGTEPYRQLAAIAMFLGELADPVFALPQPRIARAVGVSQFSVSRMIDRLVQDGLLLRECEDYDIGIRAKMYRLSTRAGEPRPARLGGITHEDDTAVRVVLDELFSCYVPVRIGSSMCTTESIERREPLLLRCLAFVAPTADEIQAFRAKVPYAGPDTDFDQVTLGELRARQASRIVGPMEPAKALTMGPIAPAGTSTSVVTKKSRSRGRRQPVPPRRTWESGTRDPLFESGGLYDHRQPHDPLHKWAWPELEEFIRAICAFSFTRADLVEILEPVWLAVENRSHVPLALALASEVLVNQIRAGRTGIYEDNRAVCDRIASKMVPYVPRAKTVWTDAGWRSAGIARPSLHIAVAILTALRLFTVEELHDMQSNRRSRSIAGPSARRARWETGAATNTPPGAPADVWPYAYSFTLEQLRMVLAMEQLPLYGVRHKDAREARMVLYRELRRLRVPLTGFSKLARMNQRYGRRRRFTMSTHTAIAILSWNGAGVGLGRLAEEARTACAA